MARGKPVEVHADRMEVNLRANHAELDGHVTLKRGALSVRSPHVDIQYDRAPRILTARAKGPVVAWYNGTTAWAGEVIVDLQRNRVELRKDVRLDRGGSTLRAKVATIDLTAQTIHLDRVRGKISGPK